MKTKQIRSQIPKHRGAVFIKRDPTRDAFVLKLYREYGYLADLVTDFLEQLVQCEACEHWMHPTEGAICEECRR